MHRTRALLLSALLGLCVTSLSCLHSRLATIETFHPEPISLALSSELRARLLEAGPAVSELRAGQVGKARASAQAALHAHPDNPWLRLVRALTTYADAFALAWRHLGPPLNDPMQLATVDFQGGRLALERADQLLQEVDHDLEVVQSVRGMQLDLCVACLQVDWDGDGDVDRADAALWQIEYDENDRALPAADRRRGATFRFDDGDVSWLRAMLSFQRAALALALAYDWRPAPLLLAHRFGIASTVRIPLLDAARARQVRGHLLAALTQALRCRVEYLAETDDVAEWFPNPGQGRHPMPVRLTREGYASWERALRALRELIEGQTALPLSSVVRIVAGPGMKLPAGGIRIAGLLEEPRDLVFEMGLWQQARTSADADPLRRFFAMLLAGDLTEALPPSALGSLLDGEAKEVELGLKSWRAQRRGWLHAN